MSAEEKMNVDVRRRNTQLDVSRSQGWDGCHKEQEMGCMSAGESVKRG